jgi:hypothetical protein
MLEFCETENIPFVQCWYYLDNAGTKKPLGEKNNNSVEQIKNTKPMPKPKERFVKNKNGGWDKIELTKDEQKSLTQIYSLFLKHTENMYCIDVDMPEINNIEDLINHIKENIDDEDSSIFKRFKKILKKSVWVKGNTKGIHIYSKFKNVPDYTDQIDVYKYFTGDFIKSKNNMWENINKEINNFNGKPTKVYDWNDISEMFNDKITHTNIVQKPKKKDINKEYDVLSDSDINTDDISLVSIDISIDDISSVKKQNDINIDDVKCNTEIELYIKFGVKYQIYKKMSGYQDWLKIGFIFKNELIKNEDGGLFWFDQISRQFESQKYSPDNVEMFYNTLKNTDKTDKNPLTFKSLIKLYKETDAELFKKILKEVKNSLKGLGQDFEFPLEKTLKFDTDFFSSLNNYGSKKQYFEIFVCKVLRPQPLYVYSENDNNTFNCLLYSEDDIIKTFKHLKSSIFKTVKDDEIETMFIKEWIDDTKLRLYNNMDFLPYNGTRNICDKTKTDTFNLFNGYNPNINLVLDKTYTDDRKEKILKPFLDLVFELVGSEEKSFNYLINFLAHLIQKPNERVPICIIFKSKQGIGKNLTFDTIGSLIGKHHYITSSNPKDFFGDYAEGFYRKLLVNMNECEGKDTFDFEGKIKSFITEDSITLNPKFVRQTTISNFARAIIFTNKPNPIPIDVRSKDRRFVVFQSTEEYLKPKYGEVFWSKLAEHFKKPEFIKTLYDYLNTKDITKIKWKEERPITQAYLEMCKLYIPVECLFLENWIQNKIYLQTENKKVFVDDDEFAAMNDDIDDNKLFNSRFEIKTVKFYQQYVDYCKKCGFINDKSFQPNINKFTSRLTELELSILKTTTSVTSVFRFIPQDVYNNMVKKNWIATGENENNETTEDKGEEFDNYFDC